MSPKKQQATPVLRAKANKTRYNDNSDDVNYTFKRVGYNVLQYFNSNYGSQLKYKFLAAAVIEPYQSIELSLYDITSLSDDSLPNGGQ